MSRRFFDDNPNELIRLYSRYIEMIYKKYAHEPFPMHKSADEFLTYLIQNYPSEAVTRPLNYFKNLSSVVKNMANAGVGFEFVEVRKRSKYYRLKELY